MVNKFHELRGCLRNNLVEKWIVSVLNAIAKEASWVQQLVVFFVTDIEENHSVAWQEMLCNIWTHSVTHVLQKETTDFHDITDTLINLL